jgi:hypothetical protein
MGSGGVNLILQPMETGGVLVEPRQVVAIQQVAHMDNHVGLGHSDDLRHHPKGRVILEGEMTVPVQNGREHPVR